MNNIVINRLPSRKPRKSKEQKCIEDAVDAAFQKLGSNIQFNVMDIPAIHLHAMTAGKAGRDIEAAMAEAIAKYRKS